jgi:hypothetical protein
MSVYSWVLAGDRGLEVVAGQTDRLAGRRVTHFLEIFEMPVSMASLALGSRAEHGGDVVEALDLGLLGEIEIAADRLDLAGKRVLKILLGLGSLERRHVPSSNLVGKADDGENYLSAGSRESIA